MSKTETRNDKFRAAHQAWFEKAAREPPQDTFQFA